MTREQAIKQAHDRLGDREGMVYVWRWEETDNWDWCPTDRPLNAGQRARAEDCKRAYAMNRGAGGGRTFAYDYRGRYIGTMRDVERV